MSFIIRHKPFKKKVKNKNMFGFIKKIFGIEDVDVVGLLAEGAVIIDVRAPGEFKSGHPEGAINIPLQSIKSNMLKIRNYEKPVIACCASGRRSGIAPGKGQEETEPELEELDEDLDKAAEAGEQLELETEAVEKEIEEEVKQAEELIEAEEEIKQEFGNEVKLVKGFGT